MTDLRTLVLTGRTLAEVERMHGDGRLSEEAYEDYRQLWRRAAPRFSDPYVWSDSDEVRPNVVGPLGAACVARFLDYVHRGVLFIDWRSSITEKERP